jgi:hypothetical protein
MTASYERSELFVQFETRSEEQVLRILQALKETGQHFRAIVVEQIRFEKNFVDSFCIKVRPNWRCSSMR